MKLANQHFASNFSMQVLKFMMQYNTIIFIYTRIEDSNKMLISKDKWQK